MNIGESIAFLHITLVRQQECMNDQTGLKNVSLGWALGHDYMGSFPHSLEESEKGFRFTTPSHTPLAATLLSHLVGSTT